MTKQTNLGCPEVEYICSKLSILFEQTNKQTNKCLGAYKHINMNTSLINYINSAEIISQLLCARIVPEAVFFYEKSHFG